MENYKEKYKDALERASKLRVQNPFDTVEQMVEHIFPELKESEYERRMKFLIKSCVYAADITPEGREEIFAWLEKQESYTFEIKEGHWYMCVCDYMLNGSDLMFKNGRLYYCRSDWRLGGEIDERNVKNIGVNGYKSFFRPATNQEIKDWLEKQGENKKLDADKLYDEVTKPHWTSVEDELPPRGRTDPYVSVPVITCEIVNRGLHEIGFQRYIFGKGKWEYCDATHWMPLPQAPTVAENATVKEKGGEE